MESISSPAFGAIGSYNPRAVAGHPACAEPVACGQVESPASTAVVPRQMLGKQLGEDGFLQHFPVEITVAAKAVVPVGGILAPRLKRLPAMAFEVDILARWGRRDFDSNTDNRRSTESLSLAWRPGH